MTISSSNQAPFSALTGLFAVTALLVAVLGVGGDGSTLPPSAAIPAETVAEEREEASVPRDSLRILEEETVLAVVVQTTGIASRFAPDHLIHASGFELTLSLDPDVPEEARFSGRIPVHDLVVDDYGLKGELGNRLLELGILDDPYDEISEKDRDRVRASMLDEDQLDGAEHPFIEVEALAIEPTGDDAFPWTVTGALTVRGTRVEAPLRARLEGVGDRIQIEAWGPFRFSDLGIQPHSAFLGAVRNQDEFHLYMRLVAYEIDPNHPHPR